MKPNPPANPKKRKQIPTGYNAARKKVPTGGAGVKRKSGRGR